MDLLRKITWGAKNLSLPTKPTQKQPNKVRHQNPLKRRLDAESPLTPLSKTKRWLKSTSAEMDDIEGDTLIGQEEQQERTMSRTTSRMKSKSPAQSPEVRKRRKQDDGFLNLDDTAVNNSSEGDLEGDLEGDTLFPTMDVAGLSRPDKRQVDRQAMPPPPKPDTKSGNAKSYVPNVKLIDRELRYNVVRGDASFSSDELAQARNQIGPNNLMEVSPRKDYERVQQYVETQTLPPGGELWTEAETDLFHRLSMRGLQPMIPGHWSVDFKTLPSQLFANDNETPLITPFSENEFRAKHFLRLLFDIAPRVRDRSLVGLPVEQCIKRPVLKYIDWALTDASVHHTQRPRVIPVHAVVTKRRSETTPALLERMQRRLYGLAMRYQAAHFLSDTIEDDETSISDAESQYEEGRMPTLIGIMIASSVVAFVTLDSRAVHPEIDDPFNPRETPSDPFKASDTSSPIEPKASPLNIIAKFDFSTHEGYDVWDGLAIAIAVMRIRRTMIELGVLAEKAGEDGPDGVWEVIG